MRRANDERNVVFLVYSFQVCGVDAAAQTLGNFELKVWLPAGVLKVVLVEVNGAVLMGGLFVVCFLGSPVATGNGAGWACLRRRQSDDGGRRSVTLAEAWSIEKSHVATRSGPATSAGGVSWVKRSISPCFKARRKRLGLSILPL